MTDSTIKIVMVIILLDRGALYRANAACSHRTFPQTICWSVCLSVCPVHCGKMADQIWMRFGMVGRMGPVMRQAVRFADLSAG